MKVANLRRLKAEQQGPNQQDTSHFARPAKYRDKESPVDSKPGNNDVLEDRSTMRQCRTGQWECQSYQYESQVRRHAWLLALSAAKSDPSQSDADCQCFSGESA